MDRTQTSASRIFRHKTDCQLIIVGTDRDGRAVCCENWFELQALDGGRLKAELREESADTAQSLSRMQTIAFAEISVRVRGAPYFAYAPNAELLRDNGRIAVVMDVPDYANTYDSRKFVRIPFPEPLPIACSIVGVRGKAAHASVPIAAELTDISAGGLSILTRQRLFFPLYLKVEVNLPGFAEAIAANGELVRITPHRKEFYRAAIEFCGLDGRLTSELDEYCRRRAIQ